jgi:hypothetical protein
MLNATQEHSEREALMRTLASRLEFSVQKTGDRFTNFDIPGERCYEATNNAFSSR